MCCQFADETAPTAKELDVEFALVEKQVCPRDCHKHCVPVC